MSNFSIPTLADLPESNPDDFIGRGAQLALLRRNLTLAYTDPERRFLFAVSGDAGVGKTTLLRRFCDILTTEHHALVAWTDEDALDLPSAMARLAGDLERQEHPLKKFNERYRVYRQRRQEFEADPDAPAGLPEFIGRTAGRAAVHLARHAPVAGVVADFIDPDAAGDQLGAWTAYIARKLTNKDEVRLLREPAAELTPLFLEDLRYLAETHPVALVFDTYEATSPYLDRWLHDTLASRHGPVSRNILWLLAGRQPLDAQVWANRQRLVARLPLDPFTDAEARVPHPSLGH